MNLIIIYFLLIGGHPILANGSVFIEMIEEDLQIYFHKGLSNFTGSDEHNLKLGNGGKLDETNHSLVWQGVFDGDVDVAVKIIWSADSFNNELQILKALNATDNPMIEDHRIPKVFYHGNFLHKYFAIALTLFDETLMDVHGRFRAQGKHLSELSILLIFKEAMVALTYLHRMGVVHNDIKPQNLCRRGGKVFISDFDLATLNGKQNKGHTIFFASSNYFAGQDRSLKDDIESLVFSMWYIAGVPEEYPEGRVLLERKKNRTAESKMKARCKYFKDENVRKVFELVAADEMLKADEKDMNLYRITTTINNAIDKSVWKFRPTQSEWLKRALNIEDSKIARKQSSG